MMRRMPVWLFAWWGLCAAWALRVRLNSPGILEGGDGVHHYQIARYAWKHPELLLDIWGKPLFTLFSSPFAQLGHWGMVLFNVVCLVVTAWAADGVLRKAGIAARLLFAPLLLFTPVYGTMVLAGMTEVFFGLLTVIVLRLLWDQRYGAAMLVASFMPFARPEYVAFVPLALAWVAYQRQWKALPFILTGHLIYGIVGTFVHKDPLWVFHQDPYTGAADIYGHGEPLHFISRFKEMFGAPLMWAVVVAVVAAIWLWVNDRTNRAGLKLLLVVGFLPALGILTLHSLLWWKGWKGSLGLLRVMATAAPLLVLCAVWPIGMAGISTVRTWPGRILGSVLLIAFLVKGQQAALRAFQELPIPDQPYEQFMRDVGERVAAVRDQYGKIVYYHPQVAFNANIDPFEQERAQLGWAPRPELPALGLNEGELLVWDAHFGPKEGRTPLEQLLEHPGVEVVDVMVPRERMVVLGGRPLEVYFFKKGQQGGRRIVSVLGHGTAGWDRVAFRADTVTCAQGGAQWCFRDGEFPLEVASIPVDTAGQLFVDLHVTGELGVPQESKVAKAVVEQRLGDSLLGYWSQDLVGGRFDIVFRLPPPPADATTKFYFWDTEPTPFILRDLQVELLRIVRPQKGM